MCPTSSKLLVSSYLVRSKAVQMAILQLSSGASRQTGVKTNTSSRLISGSSSYQKLANMRLPMLLPMNSSTLSLASSKAALINLQVQILRACPLKPLALFVWKSLNKTSSSNGNSNPAKMPSLMSFRIAFAILIMKEIKESSDIFLYSSIILPKMPPLIMKSTKLAGNIPAKRQSEKVDCLMMTRLSGLASNLTNLIKIWRNLMNDCYAFALLSICRMQLEMAAQSGTLGLGNLFSMAIRRSTSKFSATNRYLVCWQSYMVLPRMERRLSATFWLLISSRRLKIPASKAEEGMSLDLYERLQRVQVAQSWSSVSTYSEQRYLISCSPQLAWLIMSIPAYVWLSLARLKSQLESRLAFLRNGGYYGSIWSAVSLKYLMRRFWKISSSWLRLISLRNCSFCCLQAIRLLIIIKLMVQVVKDKNQ